MIYPKVVWVIGRGGAEFASIIMLLFSERNEESVLEAIKAGEIFGF